MSRPTKLDPRYVNRRVALPYGLKVEEIEQAVAETYRLFPRVERLPRKQRLSSIGGITAG